jgi:hypothetical protein
MAKTGRTEKLRKPQWYSFNPEGSLSMKPELFIITDVVFGKSIFDVSDFLLK